MCQESYLFLTTEIISAQSEMVVSWFAEMTWIASVANVEGPPEGRLGSRIVAQQGMGDKVTRGN